MRQDSPKSNIKKLSDKPLEAGTYTIIVEGLETFDEIFLEFDGKKWIGVENYDDETDGDINKICYLTTKREPINQFSLKFK